MSYHPRSENPQFDTTEWDDIQRKMGNLPPCSEDLKTLEALEQVQLDDDAAEAAEAATQAKLDKAAADELDFEDFDDEEEERFMAQYRQQRMAEMRQAAAKAKYGSLTYIDASDWTREVTDAKDVSVVALLFKEAVETSKYLEQILTRLAKKHPATKFVKIISTNAIQGYPDSNVPTLLVYRDSDIVKTVIRLDEFGGRKCEDQDVEWVLAECNAVETELEEDPRLRFRGPTSPTR